jgi:hypothetical protein
MIHKYRQWTDEAYRETDEKQSIKKWRWIFGDEFAKGADVLTEEVTGSLVPIPNFNVQRFTDTVQAIKLVGLSVLGLVRRDLPWVQRRRSCLASKPFPFNQGNGSRIGKWIGSREHRLRSSSSCGPSHTF